jgi:hypothetical protein
MDPMLPERLPEPWQEIYDTMCAEKGPEWAEKYGESSIRAAMFAMGDALPEDRVE